MHCFFTLLFLSSISCASDFSDSGIQLNVPEGFSAPRQSGLRKHERAISFSKSYPSTSAPGLVNATLIIYITAQQLTPEQQSKIEAFDRPEMLNSFLDERLARSALILGRANETIKLDPAQAITLSGEPGAKKTLTVFVNGKTVSRSIIYNTLVDFRVFEFQVLLAGDVPEDEVQALTTAIEKVRFDKNAIHQLIVD